MNTIDGIINEPTVNFVGKDGFFWWVGEVEDNEDPMELGRVKVRVLGYYTNVRGGTTNSLPTENLPWATVLQHTSQAGNDGQGESSGQLQPGAIVMGFFMDGESAQMPIVIGVMRVNKSSVTRDKKQFAFTGENMEPGVAPNPAALPPGETNTVSRNPDGTPTFIRPAPQNNSVSVPGQKTTEPGGIGSPSNIGTMPGVAGSSGNPQKPRNPEKPIPAANGVGGPWKTLEYKLSYLIEDIADTAGNLVKAENGDFIDIITGKLITAQSLTAKLQNFLSSVFAQVVAAIRQQLSNLADQLSVVTLLGGATGAPYIIFTTIQSAITQILSSLCNVDSQLIGYISDPIGSLLDILNGFLDSAIDKAQMVLQGVQAVIDSVVCQVQNIIDTMLNIVDTVATIVDGVEQAKEILEAWKKGSEIFEDGTDLIKNGITSITGIISFFLKFFSSGCNREAHGGLDTVGWFPLFGVTHCTADELDRINKIRGKQRGECGDSSAGGSLIDNIINQADPYLTQAKTMLDGSYEMFVGTPGRQASIKKTTNGTTHSSVSLNNNTYAEYTYQKKVREENPDLSTEELESRLQKYKQKSTASTGDSGNLVADHSSYAGNYTSEVHGDRCEIVDGTETITVEGDYHLKITGNCHLEVGGGFFLNAAGAPQVAPQKGASENDRIQKHTLCFGSDLDVNVSGAKFALQASEVELGAQAHKVAGGSYENACMNQNYSGGDILMNANNAIHFNTVSEYHFINFPVGNPISAKSGIFNTVRGSIDSILVPGSGGADTIPRYSVTNPSGPVSYVAGATGYNCSVTTGAYNVDVAAGLFRISASAVGTISALAALNISSQGVVRISGKAIFLN
ncbi:baseplate hub + tail lysozyme [Synechococcus phage ACG-2014b]|uniref:Baseplate hub + tail lysozyme n=1 Tax=Synechococcus phage ACG-2014b TaxID=1493508 RepID=A0A0E3EXF7_9CAUD|nr:baseplate hub + tail lysozyme [Synechococcus phage ACG-2014b]